MNPNLTDDAELSALIRLQAVLGAGNGRAGEILSVFGSAQAVFAVDSRRLNESGLFTSAQLSRISRFGEEYAGSLLQKCDEQKIQVIGIADPRFPECVRHISDPPLVLYVKGTFPDFDGQPAFCIVGPRKVSDFGAKAAYSLALRLAKAGVIIVSGGAVGSDAMAHRGALRAGGITVAVSPCGLCCDYLAANRPLRGEIVESGGCLISEFPPEQGVMRHSFPVRNRLLSALTLGTAVVEAGEHSGALITARHACEQGREVFVIPGNPTLAQYKGSNGLLRDGARPLLDASDIFGIFLPKFADQLDLERAFAPEPRQEKQKIQKKSDEGLSKEAKIVYNNLVQPKFTADGISADGISDDALLAALTELEMEGYIEALPGGFYHLL